MPRMKAALMSAMVAGGALLAAFGQFPAVSQRAASAQAHPVVIELFQSQGCSSCPPANANVNAIADRPDVLALSFAVTYWDRLGWKDTFGSPRWTARQWEYARHGGRAEVATPQVIINGGPAIVGSNRQQLDTTIARIGPPRGGPSLSAAGSTIHVGAGSAAEPSAVFLVRYDPHSRSVPINAGENGGRTLPHRDIVRELVKLGSWNGPAASFALPPAGEAGLASAIIVQRGVGGPITAALKI